MPLSLLHIHLSFSWSHAMDSPSTISFMQPSGALVWFLGTEIQLCQARGSTRISLRREVKDSLLLSNPSSVCGGGGVHVHKRERGRQMRKMDVHGLCSIQSLCLSTISWGSVQPTDLDISLGKIRGKRNSGLVLPSLYFCHGSLAWPLLSGYLQFYISIVDWEQILVYNKFY